MRFRSKLDFGERVMEIVEPYMSTLATAQLMLGDRSRVTNLVDAESTRDDCKLQVNQGTEARIVEGMKLRLTEFSYHALLLICVIRALNQPVVCATLKRLYEIGISFLYVHLLPASYLPKAVRLSGGMLPCMYARVNVHRNDGRLGVITLMELTNA
jgi:hypothetical protein